MTTIRNEPSVFTTIVERGKPSTHGRGKLCMKKRRRAPQKPASARTAQSRPLLDASHCARALENRDCEEPLRALLLQELWLQEHCPHALRSLCSCIDIFVFASPLESFVISRYVSRAPSCTPPPQTRKSAAPGAITYSPSFLFRIARFLTKSR